MPLGGQDGVEEDPPEGDLGAALVAQRVVDDQPHDAPGDQVGEDQGGQDDSQVVPLPAGGVEHGIGGVVVPLRGEAGGLPDLADGARADTDDPPGEEHLEGLEDLDAEAFAEGSYQVGEAGDKLIHRADLRAADNPGVAEHPSG